MKSKTLNILALVAGLLSTVGVFIPGIRWFAPIFAIAAIVLGVVGQKAARQVHASSGMATAGLVLGIISLVLLVLVLILGACIANMACSFLAESGLLEEVATLFQ